MSSARAAWAETMQRSHSERATSRAGPRPQLSDICWGVNWDGHYGAISRGHCQAQLERGAARLWTWMRGVESSEGLRRGRAGQARGSWSLVFPFHVPIHWDWASRNQSWESHEEELISHRMFPPASFILQHYALQRPIKIYYYVLAAQEMSIKYVF